MLKKLLLLAAIACGSIASYAVTDKEMEQARTITAQQYLRYANNGSGYLDDLSPKTMSELESALKTKEKENIKAFKAITAPKDYASWDKAKLVEYWSKTVLSSPGLKEEGRAARTRVRQRIEKMEVSAPAAQTPAPAAEAAPAPEEKPAEAAAETAPTAPESPEAALEEQVQALEEQAIAEADTEPVVEKKSSSTWIYILILCVLVGVVIWLVVYAGNAMKSQNEAAAAHASAAPKDDKESRRLKGELEQLKSENEYLKKEIEKLKRKNEQLRSQADLERTSASVIAPAPVAAASAPMAERRPENVAPRTAREPRTIYLGRVNKNGIFVRADRNFNPGASIYKLVTTDGITGSFAPVDDEQTWLAALAKPEEMLANGCAGRNLLQPEGMTEIITEAPGMAVFEGGCWRVSRKARVALA